MKKLHAHWFTTCPYCSSPIFDTDLERHITEVHRYRACLDAEDVRLVDKAQEPQDKAA